jgi:endogenous inhibitor of DNA gyrase (YacG/DUF329 family)
MAAMAQCVDLAQPFRGQCPICTEDVVVVEIDGHDVVLETMEILETIRCPRCASNVAQGKLGGQVEARQFGGLSRSKPCWRCGNTRQVGEDLPSVGVAVDQAGQARLFTGHRFEGEAIHVPHVCLLTDG